ncbi:hypothetical protein ACFVP8_12960 [Viridibacillus arvi]|uniref:hypothetical protein n=1 Tax=Viridibacillus arvi TaxID=263475 RepID=UPI00368EFCE7
MNKNKVYTYLDSNGMETIIEYKKTRKYGYRFWHVIGEKSNVGYEENQDKEGYYLAWGQSREGIPITTKPVKGKKYGIPYIYTYVVTSTNATVKTKYKTFKNCMVIKPTNKDYMNADYIYYAPHYGLVKITSKTKRGYVTNWELTSVKNKK